MANGVATQPPSANDSRKCEPESRRNDERFQFVARKLTRCRGRSVVSGALARVGIALARVGSSAISVGAGKPFDRADLVPFVGVLALAGGSA